MNFKRKGPKSTRSGCLLCKPHKRQGTKLGNRDCGCNMRRRLGAEYDLKMALRDRGEARLSRHRFEVTAD